MMLLTGSYLFKYPDILKAPIVVTTENLPVGVISKTTERINTLFVREKQLIKPGKKLAYSVCV